MGDLRDAWRALRTTPLVSGVAVLSLALGIGANSAIFSIVNSLLIRTLPVPRAERVVQVLNASQPNRGSSWSNPLWEALRSHPSLFEGAFAWSSNRFNLSERGETQFVPGLWASGDFFKVLGVQPVLGRTFTPADDARGGGPDGPVAVISYQFWQRRFGGAADAIGKSLAVERVHYTVIGVTPPEFFGPEVGRSFDVAIPIGTEPLVHPGGSSLDRPTWWWLSVMARLKPDQSLDEATAQLRALQPALREAARPPDQRPETAARFLTDPFSVRPAAAGTSSLRARYEQPLYILMGVVALVLLIACANIANLQLARAGARRHELSLRLALGSSRWRLAKLLLAESVLLSAVGATAGLLFARWGSRLLVAQLSTQANPVFLDLGIDWRVLAFTTLAAVGTTMLFGIAPALRSVRVQPMESLKQQGRTIRGESRLGMGSALVAAQIALSLVLVVGAGLFMRTFASLASLRLGFDRDPVLVVDINARGSAAADLDSQKALYARLREVVAAVPGVSAAALSLVTPVSGSTWNTMLEIVDNRSQPPSDREMYVNAVSPDWFRTMGTRLAAGRDLGDRDRAGTPDVIVINQTAARKFFPGQNPLGHTLRELGNPSETPPTRTVVGVVDDAVYSNLRAAVPPTLYVPIAQFLERGGPGLSSISLNVRAAAGAPALLTRPVAAAIEGVDKNLALTFRPLADYVDASLARERLLAMLSGFFGGLALLLAALGLYGIMSYVVSRRRTEIGIRMALGATPARVIRLVLRRLAVVLTAGIVGGAILSVWLARFVGTLLFGLQARDPLTLIGAAAVLILVSGLATWLPARRAARIDPTQALREG